jgi:hypothetical protein
MRWSADDGTSLFVDINTEADSEWKEMSDRRRRRTAGAQIGDMVSRFQVLKVLFLAFSNVAASETGTLSNDSDMELCRVHVGRFLEFRKSMFKGGKAPELVVRREKVEVNIAAESQSR